MLKFSANITSSYSFATLLTLFSIQNTSSPLHKQHSAIICHDKMAPTSLTTTNQANHQAMQSLEGESTEPRTLDRNVRHDMNLSLCEYPTAMMLTDVGEVSKEKRRDLKRSVWPFSINVPYCPDFLLQRHHRVPNKKYFSSLTALS